MALYIRIEISEALIQNLMHWLDLIQKLLSAVAAAIAIGKCYPAIKQWWGDNRQNFWSKVNQLMYGLAVVETCLLVVLLLLASMSFFMKNYSPAMSDVEFRHLCKYTFGGVVSGGLAIKGFWHYAIGLANS